MGEKISRELTRPEKAAIRKLVTSLCANYDSRYGCLPMNDECYMLTKSWTGALCRYFRDAVLPNDLGLQTALTDTNTVTEALACPVCGNTFISDGRTRYCSSDCSKIALRKQKRDYMRRKKGLNFGK